MPGRNRFLCNFPPIGCQMFSGKWDFPRETQLPSLLLTNSRRDILTSSADPPQQSKVAAMLLTVEHPDDTGQSRHMCVPALVLCCLGDGLQHLPLVNLTAADLPPAPQPSLVSVFPVFPGVTEPHRLSVFCPALLV